MTRTLLGAGGHGAVWEERRGDEAVAVKVAHGDGATFVERFRREAEALARVGPPHVPALREHGVGDDGRPYLVMERLAGRTLGAFLAGCAEPPPLAELDAVAGAVLDALAAVHATGLVHRDLKPANVFLRAGGGACIMDFGLARDPAAPGTTRAGVVVGTRAYLAPEQLRGEPADARSDLYALGCILYELATLRPPFAGDAQAVEHGHLTLRPPRPGLHRPLPAELDDLVLACLAKDPARRPPGAAALRRALAAACAAAPVARAAAAAASVRADEPAVVAWIETDGSAAAVADAVSRRGGWLASQRGGAYLAVFSGRAIDDPRAAGRAAAAELAALGARAALCVAPVAVAPGRGGMPRLAGDALDRPESWVPGGAWTGVHLAAELDEDHAAPLVGREDLVAALAAAAVRSLRGGTPVLCTLVGERGAGKSRLLAEAAAIAGRAHPGVTILTEPGADLRARAARGPVAVLVDDAHRAGDAVLDALEDAAWGGAGVALWVVVAAPPSLEELRPRWGRGVEHHERLAVPPLAPEAAAALAAHLLLPAEYPPAAALRRLVDWAACNPLYLGEAVRALRRAGLVRRRAGASGHTLATEMLDALPASPVVEWLAVRELAELPAAVAACARACAVLGADLAPTELEGLLDAADLPGAIDAGVGLTELLRAGVLRRAGGRLRWRSELLRDAVYQRLAGDEKARLHRHALAACPPEAQGEIARHAEGCGETAVAARAHLALAGAAAAAHRPLEAEQRCSRALALGAGAPALAGRGRARARMDRIPEAVADLAAARALAADDAARADLLLDEATALDWTEAHATAAERVAQAQALAGATPDPRLAHRLLVAAGRTHRRAGRAAEARDLLERAAVLDADPESRTIALLMVASSRVAEGRADDAAAALEEVIERCTRSGDRLHLAAAYGNRCFLALAQRSVDGALADLRRVVELARQDGHPHNERKAAWNLAELLFWSGGGDDEALALARRARLLEERFDGRVLPHTPLLAARILAARGDGPELRRELAWLRAHAADDGWRDNDRLLARALELLVDGGDWRALVEQAHARLPPEELLEVLYWQSRATGVACDTAELRATRPFWRRR